MVVRKVYLRNGSITRISGRGVGAVLLDGGHGTTASYASPAAMMATINGGTLADIGHHLSTGEPFRNGRHKRPPMSVEWIQKRGSDAFGTGLRAPRLRCAEGLAALLRPCGRQLRGRLV